MIEISGEKRLVWVRWMKKINWRRNGLELVAV